VGGRRKGREAPRLEDRVKQAFEKGWREVGGLEKRAWWGGGNRRLAWKIG
jgi:hypothetical protein